MKKKILAIILAAILLLTMTPTAAFAELTVDFDLDIVFIRDSSIKDILLNGESIFYNDGDETSKHLSWTSVADLEYIFKDDLIIPMITYSASRQAGDRLMLVTLSAMEAKDAYSYPDVDENSVGSALTWWAVTSSQAALDKIDRYVFHEKVVTLRRMVTWLADHKISAEQFAAVDSCIPCSLLDIEIPLPSGGHFEFSNLSVDNGKWTFGLKFSYGSKEAKPTAETGDSFAQFIKVSSDAADPTKNDVPVNITYDPSTGLYTVSPESGTIKAISADLFTDSEGKTAALSAAASTMILAEPGYNWGESLIYDWYVISGKHTSFPKTMTHDVNLLLLKNADLKNSAAVTGGKNLKIYAQAPGSGKLTFSQGNPCYTGNLTTYGGYVILNNTKGNLTVYGGSVTLNEGLKGNLTTSGGTVSVNNRQGFAAHSDGSTSIEGSLTVYDGTVTVNGGIGGVNGTQGKNGGIGVYGSVTVNGGSVTVNGGTGGSPDLGEIGGTGAGGNGGIGIQGAIALNGGQLTVNGGSGGGIFGGSGTWGKTAQAIVSTSVTITSGLLTATGENALKNTFTVSDATILAGDNAGSASAVGGTTVPKDKKYIQVRKGTLTNEEVLYQADGGSVEAMSFADAFAKASGADNGKQVSITLQRSIVLKQAITVSSGAKIQLHMIPSVGSHLIFCYPQNADSGIPFNKSMFTVEAGGELTVDGNILCGILGGSVIYDPNGESYYYHPTFENGGIFINHGKLTINSIRLMGGYAAGFGGAVYNDGEDAILTMENALPYMCQAGLAGGAIYNKQGTVELKNTPIDLCSVTDTTAGEGSAIYNTGVLTITGGTQIQNCFASAGSVIYNDGEAVNGGDGLNTVLNFNGDKEILTYGSDPTATAITLHHSAMEMTAGSIVGGIFADASAVSTVNGDPLCRLTIQAGKVYGNLTKAGDAEIKVVTGLFSMDVTDYIDQTVSRIKALPESDVYYGDYRYRVSMLPKIKVTRKTAGEPAEEIPDPVFGTAVSGEEMFTITTEYFSPAPTLSLQYGHVQSDGSVTWDGNSPSSSTGFALTISGAAVKVTTSATTPAGDYLFRITNSQTGEDLITSDTMTLTIQKTDSSVTTAPAAKSLTYNGQAQELVSAGVCTGGTMMYRVGESGDYSSSIPTAKNAGTYAVYYYVQGDGSHTDTQPASVSVTIAKKALTVTAGNQEKTYGQPDPTLTWTAAGLVSGETLTAADVEISRAAGEDVVNGGYAITVTAKETATTGNYDITTVPGTFTIKKADYTGVSKEVRVTIKGTNSADVTLPDIPDGTAYGEVTNSADEFFTISAISGNSLTVQPKEEGSGMKFFTVAVDPDGNHNGYIITVYVMLSSKEQVTITAASDDFTYGDTGKTGYKDVSVAGETGLTESDLSVMYYRSDGSTKTTDDDGAANEGGMPAKAGTYKAVIYVPQGNDSYTGSKIVTFTIAKKALTVTAKPKTIVFGDAGANDGVEYSGFADGEDEGDLSGTLSYSYKVTGTDTDYAAGTSPVGAYDIVPFGLTSDNYEITFVSGVLTVTQKTIEKPTENTAGFIYTGSPLTYTPTDFDSATMDISGNLQTNANESGYTVTVTPKSNYKWDGDCTFNWIIRKATPVITAPTAAVLTYGHALKDCVLSDGGSDTDGVFAWEDDTIAPTVAQSGSLYNVTFHPKDTDNYNTAACQVSVTVVKADYSRMSTKMVSLPAADGGTVEIKLPGIPEGTSYGTVTNDPGNLFTLSDLSGSTLTATAKGAESGPQSQTFTVAVIPDENHNGYDITVTVLLVYRKDAAITAEGEDFTYGDTGKKGYKNFSTTAPSALIDDLVITYYRETDTPGTYETTGTTEVPTDAGSYKVVIAVPESDLLYKGGTTVYFTIAKATPSEAPAVGEGYSLDENLIITITDGYEVHTDEDFGEASNGGFIQNGERLTPNQTYYVRKAADENHNASPARAFVAIFELCEYLQKLDAPKNGLLSLKLNGSEAEEFTFTQSDAGWYIQDADGNYLTLKSGRLVRTTDEADATVWKYGARLGFSTSVSVATQTAGFRFLFWFIPPTTRITTTTYYLTSTAENAALRTCPTDTQLSVKISDPKHDFGGWTDCEDGENHRRVCANCGKEQIEPHHFEHGVCTDCGARDPLECDLSVSYTQVPKTVYGWFWTRYTVYTVKINVTGSDRESVTKVEYSLDGGLTWYRGTTITANTEIRFFQVRVTDDHGRHVFTFPQD